jgi:SAM-dependent methyltransferase
MEYIKEYTRLNAKELRQLRYKRLFKKEFPDWDDSMVLLKRAVQGVAMVGSTVLDFGCGRGNFVLDELEGVFSQKIGFDVDEESTRGNKTNNEIIIGIPGKSLPFSDQYFDAIVSLWVLEHIEDPNILMSEIFRILKPGGFFAFVTPNKKSLLVIIRRMLSDGFSQIVLKKLYGREDEDIFKVYYRMNTKKDIINLAHTYGFEISFLEENVDPSYTAFNALTYTLSKLFARLMPDFASPHIVAVLKRTI